MLLSTVQVLDDAVELDLYPKIFKILLNKEKMKERDKKRTWFIP